jgi:signal transduction histidine kinase
MISDLMLFARPPQLRPAPCDLGQLVRQVTARHQVQAADRNISIACHVDDECHPSLMLDETQIAVAIDAIITNAIEAVGADGHVEISVRSVPSTEVPAVEISVQDDGPGISDHVRQHMFEPFFSGREAGRGLGFGLSKCWRIVTDHGGQVVVRQSADCGAEIAILLPLPR